MNPLINKFLTSCFSSKTINGLRFISRNRDNICFIKSAYYNFKYLPIDQAVHFPLLIGHNVNIKKIGKINFLNDIYPGIFTLGVVKLKWESSSEQLIFNNSGTINIGGRVKLHPGAKFYIKSSAVANFGNNVGIGYHGRFICFESITIGNDFSMSWEGQIMDTDFHFLHNIGKDKYYDRVKPILIGDNVFVGNRCTIGKGTTLLNGCVISCCSKVSGNFSEKGTNLLIVGNPGSVVKNNVEMIKIWPLEIEQEIAFKYNLK